MAIYSTRIVFCINSKLEKESIMAQTYHSDRQHADSYANDKTDWKAGVWAGLIAGVVFMMAEMLMVWMFMGQSPWGPPRMIAAMVMGKGVLPPPAAFDMGIMMMAMAIHFMLSIVLGLLFAWIVHRLANTSVTVIGGLFGLTVYFINFHLIAPVMFPWFTNAQNWVSIVAHLIFGLTLGISYARMRHHKPALRQ
jgi:hypothetical protein